MKKTFTILIAAIAAIFFLAQPLSSMADDVTVVWTISGPATTANGAPVNTVLNTSNVTGGSGTWTAVSVDNSYAGTNSGIQLGSKNYSFNGTISLSNSSIPSTATITSIVINAKSGGSYSVSVTVGGASYDNSKTINSSTSSNYTFEATGTGNDIVFTLSTSVKKYFALSSITVNYTESSDPSIEPSSVSPIAYNAISGSITYQLKNPASASDVITASVPDGSWLTIGTITTTSVPFTMSANNNGPLRTETVTLSYDGADDVEVTITQNADPSYLCGGNVTITFSELYSNGDAFSSYTTPVEQGNYITLTGNKGSNSNGPKYYDTGSAVRFYGGNTLTVSTKNNTNLAITKVEFTFDSGEDQNSISADCGVYDSKKPGTWLGVNAPVVFTISGSSGHRRVKTVTVYYALRLSGEQTDLNITSPYAIVSGSTVTGTLSCANAANLVIADGGKLYTTSENVHATIYKEITAPDDWDASNKSGWFAISSPVGDIANPSTSVTYLAPAAVNSIPQFDLYKYSEGHGWYNYNNPSPATPFGGIVNGQGYIYSRSTDATLVYSGTITTGAVSFSDLSLTGDTQLSGIHFLGNPYTHDIYKGTGASLTVTEGSVETGYYMLNSSSLWIAAADNTPIAPGQGFLVKVTTENTDLSMTNTPNTPSSRSNNDFIKFSIANSLYEDVAYAWFDKGEGLTKINHRNEDAPMVYINQSGKNYAIATMSDDTKSFNLNFKAMTTGKYTLKFQSQGDYSYLHVIDRFTGEDIDMLLDGEYSFIGTSSDNDNRFIVNLAYLPYDSENNNETFAFQNGNEIFVSGNGELQIFDITGRTVMTTTINGAESINLSAKGVFIFRLVGNDIKTQKIVVR